MKDLLGIYIHVPFCSSKCPYCNFYSRKPKDDIINLYKNKLKENIYEWSKSSSYTIDTLYFGGGTPSILGSAGLSDIINEVFRDFYKISENLELTSEMNPNLPDNFDFYELRMAGVNRLSIGLQSASPNELSLLGRKHDTQTVRYVVNKAFQAGIKNISFDIMLGIQGQSLASLRRSLDFCLACNVKHISAYMLKVEPGTVYYNKRNSLLLPSEDEVCDLYLYCCDYLEKNGLKQYEISNFAVPGFESKHNLKYWNCDDYLGIGPSAHSFMNGKRFYTEPDIERFLNGSRGLFYKSESEDINDNDKIEEYIMLRLRLNSGLTNKDFKYKFGFDLPDEYFKRAESLKNTGLVKLNSDSISLTRKGFLVSNQIITKILFGV